MDINLIYLYLILVGLPFLGVAFGTYVYLKVIKKDLPPGPKRAALVFYLSWIFSYIMFVVLAVGTLANIQRIGAELGVAAIMSEVFAFFFVIPFLAVGFYIVLKPEDFKELSRIVYSRKPMTLFFAQPLVPTVLFLRVMGVFYITISLMTAGSVILSLKKYETYFSPTSPAVSDGLIYTSLTKSVIEDEEVELILKSFAEMPIYSGPPAGNAEDYVNALNGALDKRDVATKNIVDRLKKELVPWGEALQDAPDLRSFMVASTKVCLAESVVYNSLTDTLSVCGIEELYPADINWGGPDDLTGDAAILPYFMAGMAYYKNGDQDSADYYFRQIRLHKEALQGLSYEPYMSSVYKAIIDKVDKISTNAPDTEGWQTYRNDEFGFEVKYPENDVSAQVINNANGYFDRETLRVLYVDTTLNQETTLPTSPPSGAFHIYVDENPIWLDRCLISEVTSQQTPDEVVQINGVQFVRFDESSAASGGSLSKDMSYRALHNNKCYRIESKVLWRDINFYRGATTGGSATQEEISEQQALIQAQFGFNEQILSTFLFIR